MASIVQFIYIFNLFVILNAQNENCVYPNLNISGLDGLSIICPFENDNTMYSLHYQPCQTNLQCSIFDLDTYMAIQLTLSGNCVTGIARYDSNVLPQQIYIDGTEAYLLSYANGQASFDCSESRKFNLTFICDPNADPYDANGLNCGEDADDSCSYYLEIPTIYACNNEPEHECSWQSPDGNHILNLTSIAGNIYNGVSGDDSSQIYEISVCSNNVNCNEQSVMSSIISNSNCIKSLARWDNGITTPSYNENLNSWQFIYTNGDSCGGFQSVYYVYWNCNQFSGEAQIMAARQIATCSFEIQIDSNLAC